MWYKTICNILIILIISFVQYLKYIVGKNKVFQNYQKEKGMKIFCLWTWEKFINNSITKMLRHLPCLECHHGRNQVKGLCICTKQIVWVFAGNMLSVYIPLVTRTRKVIKVLFRISLQISKFIKQNYNDLYIIKTRLRIQIFILFY